MSNVSEMLSLMESTRAKFFSELDVVFQLEKRPELDGEAMQVVFGSPIKIILHYGNDKVLEHKYRMGLVLLISHELGHIINPVDPEQTMAGRLPEPMIQLWSEMRKEGLALCSLDAPGKDIDA